MYGSSYNSGECSPDPGIFGYKGCPNYPGCGCGGSQQTSQREEYQDTRETSSRGTWSPSRPPRFRGFDALIARSGKSPVKKKKKKANTMGKAFFGIGKADATSSEGSRNPFFEYKSEKEGGRFVIEVVACKLATRNAPTFILEAIAIESNVENCPVGETYAWVQGLQKDLGPLSVKRFLAAAMGLNPKSDEANEEITDEVAEQSVSDENPLKGVRLKLRTRYHLTNNKTAFTIHDFMPIEEVDAPDPKDNE